MATSSRKMAKAKGKMKPKATTGAIHAHDADGKHHVVGVWNLHVLIVADGNFWFAQGLEIDCAVQGSSVADAKRQFEIGFRSTIHQHLKIFGHIGHMLRVAPNEVWLEYFNTPKACKIFSHASMHQVVPELATQPAVLQFEQIEYAELKTAA